MAAVLFTLPQDAPLQSGAVVAGAKANFYITGTTTRQNTFKEKALSTAHTNPVIADANGVFAAIFLNDALNYKVDVTDASDVSLPGYPIDDIASGSTLEADLASTANAKGASKLALEDAAGIFLSTDVEAALAEIRNDLADTANGAGASDVAIEDSAALITATTVEAAFAEIIKLIGVTKHKTADESVTSSTAFQDDNHLTGWDLTADKYYSFEALLSCFQNIGNYKCRFNFSNAIQIYSLRSVAVDSTGVISSTTADFSRTTGDGFIAQGITDNTAFGLHLKGFFRANASTGGTLDFQWAQETESANATITRDGSWMNVSQRD